MINALNDEILQVMTNKFYIYATKLQKLHYIVVVAVDGPLAAQNSQKNKSTTLHNTICIFTMVEIK